MTEFVGIDSNDSVVEYLMARVKNDWKITRVTFEEKRVVKPSEPRKWIHLTCLSPDGQSYDYSYNYLKIKRGFN